MPDGTRQPFLRFENVKKSYDQKSLVVKGFSLDVAEGEFITLLGPSGSGKTTVLMMLAGFEAVTSGEISLDGTPITRIPPYRRNIGMVFQNYALFPHMTSGENLAYPLKVRGKPRTEIEARVKRGLEMIELPGFAGRFPGQLSGGQRQRVALARALVFEPSLVLMDEPLGALDKNLREQMQYEISRLHKELGFTVIYVTHDQVEALSMSDRIAVFNDGVVQQCAAPAELYETPATAFCAAFIGENNFVPGTVAQIAGGIAAVDTAGGERIAARVTAGASAGAKVRVSVRPEKLFIQPTEHAHDNALAATFVTRHYVGDFIRYYFRLRDGAPITVKVLNDLAAPSFADGQEGELVWLKKDCFAFPAD